jgi:hypothetical protein
VKFRLPSLGLLVVCTLFAACSGYANGIPPSASSPSPTATPGFVLTGTMIQNYTYRYGFPSPLPPLTIKTRVVQRVSIVKGGAPKGYPTGSNQIVSVKETDETKLATNTFTTLAYVAVRPSEDLLYASSTQIAAADGAQSSVSTTKYTQPRIVAQSGASPWTNSPASTIDESFSDGHSEDRTIAGDGTYVEHGTALTSNTKLVPTTLEDTSSGAGSYTAPFEGCPPDMTESVSAPAGDPLKITLSVSAKDDSACNGAPISYLAWFPATPTFYREADSNRRAVVPSSCGSAKGLRSTDVRSDTEFLDTIIGYVEQTRSDTYSVSTGTVCVTYSDAMFIYYDYQGDTPYFLVVSPNRKPIATVLTQETLTASDHGVALPAIATDALLRHFFARLEPERERLRSALVQRFARAQGGSQ